MSDLPATKSHEELLRERGLRVRDLVQRTGMSEAGVRKCLRRNTAPTNPLLAREYLAALGLPDRNAP